MSQQRRSRRVVVVCVVLLVAAGLASRRAWMPQLVIAYAGDTLWGMMFFGLFAGLWPADSSLRTGCFAVATTELIEFSQLWQASWLQRFRATAIGGLLLGHGFLWSDVLCVALGASIAALVDRTVRPSASVAGGARKNGL